MSIQPYSSNQKIVIERRFPDGTLDLKGEQPPAWTIEGLTLDDVYHRLFWADPKNNDLAGTAENLHAWLKEKGWAMRSKYW